MKLSDLRKLIKEEVKPYLKEDIYNDVEDYDEYFSTDEVGDTDYSGETQFNKIVKEFGQPFSHNADWGGHAVWSVRGNKTKGIFIYDSSELNNDEPTYDLIYRKVDANDEYIDKDLFNYTINPDNTSGTHDIDEFIKKALEYKK